MAVEAVIITVSIVVLAFALLLGMNFLAGNSKQRKTAVQACSSADGRGGSAGNLKNVGRFLPIHKYYEAALGVGDEERDKPDAGMQDELCLLVKHNMSQLDEMYNQVENEQKNAFNSALLVSFLGFGLLAAGIVLAYANSAGGLAIYTTVGGAIVELISGLFFWIYSNCSKQTDELYANLVETQKILMSVQLIGKVGEDKQDDAYLGVIGHIMANGSAPAGSSNPTPDPPANGTATS